jgi:hypothetical protein
MNEINVPISLATAVLLGLLWVGISKAMLAKVLWNVLRVFSLAGVVTVVILVSSGH